MFANEPPELVINVAVVMRMHVLFHGIEGGIVSISWSEKSMKILGIFSFRNFGISSYPGKLTQVSSASTSKTSFGMSSWLYES